MLQSLYFSKFPKILYALKGDKVQQLITDIVHRCRIRKVVQDNTAVFTKWIISDGETPEMVAHKYYGDPNYWWVVMMSNNLQDPYYDWPLGYNQLVATLVKMYGSITESQQAIHHYEDENGNWIDQITYNSVGLASWDENVETFNQIQDDWGSLNSVSRVSVTCYDYWSAVNESKREIKLLDSQFLPQVVKEIDKLLQEV